MDADVLCFQSTANFPSWTSRRGAALLPLVSPVWRSKITVSVFVSVGASYLTDIHRQHRNSCNHWNRLKGRRGNGSNGNCLEGKGLERLP